MDADVSTSSAVSIGDDRVTRVTHWLLVRGDRRTVAGLLVVGVVLVVGTLIALGVVDVGPGGSTSTVLGSGLTSGVVTLVTIALSINQLILTRVFGSPASLSDRLEGTRDLRREVESIAGVSSSPNDPADFLSLLATTLRERAVALGREVEASNWDPPADLETTIRDLVEYGGNIDDRLEGQTEVVAVLDVVLGSQYARNMRAVHHLRNEYADSLSGEASAEFEAIEDLLESLAVTRQFFKTISLQQDFAHLSRMIVYLGSVALVVAVSLTLVYRTNSVTLPASVLPVVVTLGLGVVASPLAVFVAYVLRAATIAHRTVSVGPFVPPRGQY